jgi:hypothetical protein
MGQIIINFSYFIINSPFLIKEKISEIFCPKKKNKHSYIPMEFDDDIEEHATIMTSEEINSMIQNQKNNEEYKIIKNKDDEDVNLKKDIDLIKEEVKQIDIENNNNNNNNENNNNSDDEDLDKIKKELLNNNDEE